MELARHGTKMQQQGQGKKKRTGGTGMGERGPVPHRSNKLQHWSSRNTQPCTTAWCGLRFLHLMFLQTISGIEKLLIISVSEQQFQVEVDYTSNYMESSLCLVKEFLRSTKVTVGSRTAAAITVPQRQNGSQPAEELVRPWNCPWHNTQEHCFFPD